MFQNKKKTNLEFERIAELIYPVVAKKKCLKLLNTAMLRYCGYIYNLDRLAQEKDHDWKPLLGLMIARQA